MDIQIWNGWMDGFNDITPPTEAESTKRGLKVVFVLSLFFLFVFYFIAWELLDRLFLLGSKLGWVKKDTATIAFKWIWSQGNPDLQRTKEPIKERTYQKNLLWMTTASHPISAHLSSNKSLLKGSKVDQLPNLPWSPKTGGMLEDLPVYHALENGPPPSQICLKIRHIVFHLVCCIFALAATAAFTYVCIFLDDNCRNMMTALQLPDYSCEIDYYPGICIHRGKRYNRYCT